MKSEPMLALIAAVLLAPSAWPDGAPADGALPVMWPAESAAIVLSSDQPVTAVAPGVCKADAKLATPPPCSCDGKLGLGCGAERVVALGPGRAGPFLARGDGPPTAGSMNDLFDPHQSSPPPRRSS